MIVTFTTWRRVQTYSFGFAASSPISSLARILTSSDYLLIPALGPVRRDILIWWPMFKLEIRGQIWLEVWIESVIVKPIWSVIRFR
jgi:hypothetical protein